MRRARILIQPKLITFFVFGFIFWHLARQMLQIKNGEWFVGQVNLYGDLVFHIGLINKFLASGNALVSSPFFFDSKPNYPIFTDFITAQVAKTTGINFALFITTFLGGLLVIYVSRFFVLSLIRNEKAVFLTLLLFLVNGGFGFFYFFQDFLTKDVGFFEFFYNLPRQYTDIKENGYWWINSYLAYFLPQRGFLFAFPITLTTLLLLLKGVKKNKLVYFVTAGFLAGALPLVQAHSLFVLFILSSFYFVTSLIIYKNKKSLLFGWLIYMAITAIMSIILFKSISNASNPLEFIKFGFGWTSEENIFWFWLKNLGLFGPVLIAALVWLYKKSTYLLILYLPFLFLFVISNILVFQPWDFDNSKILIYWFFASSIVVAYFLVDYFFGENIPKKIAGISLIFIMILAGALDIYRTFTPVTNYQIFSKEDIETAESVKRLTDKNSLFISSSAHNDPITALTGRTTLLGFHGWAWSHGLPYQERAQDIKNIYLGGQQAEDLIIKYKIDYIAIGTSEEAEFSINKSYFKKFPEITINGSLVLYDVSSLWSDRNRQN